MNKKLIAMAIAGALAAPLAAQAADVSFSGDARLQYANTDTSGATANPRDDRVRVRVTADMGDGVKAVARFRAQATNGVVDDADESYIVLPIGPVTATLGDQYATWGTGAYVQNSHKPGRVKLAMKAGGWTLLGMDDFGIGTVAAVGSIAGFNAGVINTSQAEFTDVFVTGNAGPVGIAFENFTKASNSSMLVQATMGFGSVTGVLAYVSLDAGTALSNYFAPISTIGTGVNIGANTALQSAQATDETVTLAGAVAAVGGGTVNVFAGSYSLDSISIVDVQYTAKVTDAASVRLSYGTLKGNVTDFTRMGAQVDVKF